MIFDACNECSLAIILFCGSALCTTTTEYVCMLMGQEVIVSQKTKQFYELWT